MIQKEKVSVNTCFQSTSIVQFSLIFAGYKTPDDISTFSALVVHTNIVDSKSSVNRR